jgi:hypothetical protein
MDSVKDSDNTGSLAVSFFPLQFGQTAAIFNEICNYRSVSDDEAACAEWYVSFAVNVAN